MEWKWSQLIRFWYVSPNLWMVHINHIGYQVLPCGKRELYHAWTFVKHCSHADWVLLLLLWPIPSLSEYFYLYPLPPAPLKRTSFFFLSLSTLGGLHYSIFFPPNFYANSSHLFTATLSQIHVTLLRWFKVFRVIIAQIGVFCVNLAHSYELTVTFSSQLFFSKMKSTIFLCFQCLL